MLIHETAGGEKIYRRDNSIVVLFPGPRRVVASTRINGGLREDLVALFNHHLPPERCTVESLPGGSAEAYLALTAEALGLPPERAAGMLTAAKMENASIKECTYRDLTVTAVVTAGVDVNGGRAGDPASYYERDGKWEYVGGTINIILLLNGNLLPHVLVRAVVTATEAKAAALQELMAPSRVSPDIATGSGTDQIAIAAVPDSPCTFTDAGKHSKLGELIGRCVKEAVKEALEKETGLNAGRQQSFLARLARYGLTEEDFWRAAGPGRVTNGEEYRQKLAVLAQEEKLVALAAALLHLLDEYRWGLLTAPAVRAAGEALLRSCLPLFRSGSIEKEEDPVSGLLRMFVEGVNNLLLAQAGVN